MYTDQIRNLAYGTDTGFYRLIPKIIIRAMNEDEVQKALLLANKYELPVTFRAAGTSLAGQAITDSILIVAGKNWEQCDILKNGDEIRMQPGIVWARANQMLAPFVKYEWGEEAYHLMKEIKHLFDPKNSLNPGIAID